MERLKKYGLLSMWIFISLIGALVYDYYRNRPSDLEVKQQPTPRRPTVSVRNPLDLKNPLDTKLGDIEGSVSATELFDGFLNDEVAAQKKYIGKTYLITGLILESFDLKVKTQWQHTFLTDKRITAGIMLLPESPSFLNRVQTNFSIDQLKETLPQSVEADMDPDIFKKEYAKFLEPSEPDLHYVFHDWSYDFYSDDFSFLSRYGGVYCMFEKAFSSGTWGFPDRKKKITCKCKIREYKREGLEKIEQYKVRKRVNELGVRKTKSRVIAVGCVEINSEWSQ